jgi:predicted metal-dependent HD superfamily phosphohydrolase
VDEELLTRWRVLLPGPPVAVVALGRELLTRYAEPHRRYHDLTHLREVLDAVDGLAAYAVDPDAVRLAAWFHDAVYDGRPGADEEASARLAEARLPACGVASSRVAQVARLVRVTAGHAPADDDRDGIVLCDADLAILAADPPRYRSYSAAVRAEYAHVPAAAFRQGRRAVLEDLLARPALYRTPTAQAAWTGAARRNLTREIRWLDEVPSEDA